MALFEGKSSTERNKIIAAAVLGLVALIALYMAFGRSFFGGTTTTASIKSSPTPRPSNPTTDKRVDIVLPTSSEQDFVYQTTPVDYRPGNAFAPDPGKNIFAFYEPPAPTPYSPTPYVAPPVKTPVPPPPPPFLITVVTPQSVYAGSRGFRLEVNGDKFTPDSQIYFNQSVVPTVFINAQKLVADIPSNFIAQEGAVQVIVQTPDGKLYSNAGTMAVQQPPRPGFQFIGMIGRKRYNNDTAYFLESNKTTPFGARLNDVIGGRFRLIDISSTEVVFVDVDLGFKHRLPISKSTATGSSGQPTRTTDGGFVPFDPNVQNIPGIPNNIPRYIPPQPKRTPTDNKEDVDDDGDPE